MYSVASGSGDVTPTRSHCRHALNGSRSRVKSRRSRQVLFCHVLIDADPALSYRVVIVRRRSPGLLTKGWA
jgi:hypothetical protein